ncbi:MAG: siderophore-interacting protein [Actinomycetota bacterium]
MSLRLKAKQMTVKNEATVTATSEVGDGLLGVSAEARNRDLVWEPGQAVALVVDPDGSSMKDRWRHYTVRGYDRESGTIDFLLTRHDPDTPGGRWIDSLEVGSTFTFMGPGGNPVLRPGADHYVLVGDRTSLASVSAMLDGLSANADAGGRSPTAEVIVATPDPDAAVLPTTEDWPTTWIRATSADDIRQRTLVALPQTVAPGTRAYVTGEMTTMRAVRDTLIERGVAKKAVGTHAHWTPGRRGM